VEARIAVDGTDADRVALWDWLFDDPDLRDLLGRDASIEVNRRLEYVVIVEGPVAIWAALARSLALWIVRRQVGIRLAGPRGRTATVGPAGDPEMVLRRVLGALEFSTPA
jgi:membrane-associated two-gene conflict system component 1 (EACC1)